MDSEMSETKVLQVINGLSECVGVFCASKNGTKLVKTRKTDKVCVCEKERKKVQLF